MKNVVEFPYPNMNKEFILHVDASDSATGATLSQLDEMGNLRLVSCMSKKLNPAEKNYPPHEREMLALVQSLQYWRSYLWGSNIPVRVFTDSSCLRYLKTQKVNTPRQARWIGIIESYNTTWGVCPPILSKTCLGTACPPPTASSRRTMGLGPTHSDQPTNRRNVFTVVEQSLTNAAGGRLQDFFGDV